MLYQLQYGKLERTTLAQSKSTFQGRLPKWLLEAPELEPELQLYWEAFFELSTCRPSAFSGIAPIPWTAIQAYADAYRFDEDQRFLLSFHVSKMDKATSEWHEKHNGDKHRVPRVPNSDGKARRRSRIGNSARRS